MASLVSTKFRVPPLDAALVPRPALMVLFDRGLACRLTLVAAPAGYGKTTTTALWAHSLIAAEQARIAVDPHSDPDLRVAWYALDDDDDDFAVFFTRLVTAIEAACPGALADVPTGLDIVAMQPAQFTPRLVDGCLRLPAPVVLVLDDYHLITAAAIHATLAQLIQYAGEQVHLVIATRHDPPLPISRLRVQRQVVEVRAGDLRMTAAEARALLANQLDRPPAAKTVALLLERTEGWVAGLQLAAIALEQEDSDEFVTGIQRNTDRHVTDFLIDEVLERAPADLRQFLLLTALVARFNAEVAAHLTGFDPGECRRYLDQLLQRNLFLVVLDADATWFRYHHQFRTMLLSRSSLALRPDELISRRRCAIEWLVEHGWSDEAITELVADRAWDAAADLIEAGRHQLYNREQWLLVWRRLAQLPPDIVEQRPALLLSKAWVSQTQLRHAAMVTLCERVAALLDEAPPGTGGPEEAALAIVRGEVAALRSSWLYGNSAGLAAAERGSLVEQALRLLQPAQQYAWVRGYCYSSLTHYMLSIGQREEMQRRLEQEIHAADIDAGPYLTRLHHSLGVLLMWDGALDALLPAAERYLQLATQHRMIVSAAWANVGLGWTLYQQGQPVEAMQALLRAFERPHQVHMQATLIGLYILVPVATQLGRLDEVAKLAEQLHRHALDREAFVVVDDLAALRALIACRRGDLATALAWATAFADASPVAAVEVNSSPILTGPISILTQIALAAGAEPLLRRAVELLHQRTDLTLAIHRTTETMQSAVLLACCHRRLGQPVAALQALELALALGWPRGFRTVFLEHTDDLAPLLQTLVQRRLGTEAAALLAAITAQQAHHQPAPVSLVYRPENAVVGLTEREAEILELLAQNLSNKEIAGRLHISPITVRNHTSNIFDKLHVRSRRQAVAQAQAINLLPPPA